MVASDSFALENFRGEFLELHPHPESCTIEEVRDYATGLTGPIAIDLFCGAGGLSLGLVKSGFSMVLGVDKDASAISTHRAQFGGASVCLDLSQQSHIDQIVGSLADIPLDLVAGSPPCQPFSTVGRNKIRSLVNRGIRPEIDPRVELWRGFVEVVRRTSPRSVLIENVPGIALGEDAAVFRQLVDELEGLGFDVYSRVLSAANYGVPQYRQRLFIVGVSKGNKFTWPASTTRHVLQDAISDLPPVDANEVSNPCEYSPPETSNSLVDWLRDGVEGEYFTKIHDHVPRRVREDDLNAYRQMDSKTRYFDLPEELRRYRSDIFVDKYKRLAKEELSRTITAHIAKDGYWYIHPDQHRTLTVREAARIQTFPDWFRFAGFPTNAFRQIGEAVPPLMAVALGRSVLDALQSASGVSGPVSTSEVSKVLEEWLENTEEHELVAPWRKSDSLWHVLLGMVLFEPLSRQARQMYWGTIRDRWKDPASFLHDTYGAAACRALGQGSKLSLAYQIASALHRGADSVDDAKGLDGLTQEQIRRARAICGLDAKTPLTTAAARVCERTSGEQVGESKIHGQLLLSRLIGNKGSGRGYAAVLEIGERFCVPSVPHCRNCPLKHMCQMGSSADRHEISVHLL